MMLVIGAMFIGVFLAYAVINISSNIFTGSTDNVAQEMFGMGLAAGIITLEVLFLIPYIVRNFP